MNVASASADPASVGSIANVGQGTVFAIGDSSADSTATQPPPPPLPSASANLNDAVGTDGAEPPGGFTANGILGGAAGRRR
jgi:hypothetical protein